MTRVRHRSVETVFPKLRPEILVSYHRQRHWPTLRIAGARPKSTDNLSRVLLGERGDRYPGHRYPRTRQFVLPQRESKTRYILPG